MLASYTQPVLASSDTIIVRCPPVWFLLHKMELNYHVLWTVVESVLQCAYVSVCVCEILWL